MDRIELANFLFRKREALQPSDVGLPNGPRRRVAGLRREEVATISSMSTDYYTRLEQRRGPQPSEQMLSSLARGLRLTLDERDHLFRLAGHEAPTRVLRSEHVSPPLMRVLDRLEDSPAMVVTDLGWTLAQNRLAVALYGDQTRFTGLARSGVYRWFTDSREGNRYPEIERDHHARMQVSNLRASMSRGGPDPRATALVKGLREKSAEFAELWERHEVAVRAEDHKTIVHPEVGQIELDSQKLYTQDQSQALLVLTATPGSESHDKLKLLSAIGTQHFDSTSSQAGLDLHPR